MVLAVVGCWFGFGSVGGGLFGIFLIYIFYITTVPSVFTRRVGMANGIASDAGRKVPNIGMRIGNATAKAVASFSNGCSVSIPSSGSALIFSFVNCIARRIPINKGGMLGIRLGSSARALSRMIMITCNATEGDSLANTATDLHPSTGSTSGATSFGGLLRNGITKLGMASSVTTPKTTDSIAVHNTGSLHKSGRPLCIVSGIPRSSAKRFTRSTVNNNSFRVTRSPLDTLGPTSVRSVAMLGSTSTATVCNSHNTGNIVVVAAGGKGTNGTGMGIATGFAVTSTHGLRGVLGLRRCTTCTGVGTGSNRRGCCPRTGNRVRCICNRGLSGCGGSPAGPRCCHILDCGG